MSAITFEVYKILEKKLGEAEATIIVKAIDVATNDMAVQKKLEVRDELVKELANKSDLVAVEASVRGDLKTLEARLDGKMKLYFAITIAVILLTNSKAMDVIAKLLGFIK
jgi:hypothetical protein